MSAVGDDSPRVFEGIPAIRASFFTFWGFFVSHRKSSLQNPISRFSVIDKIGEMLISVPNALKAV